MTRCPYCYQLVDYADHLGQCPAVAAAFDPRVRPDRVARVPSSAKPCARCGGGPRVHKLAYCRKCKTAINRASWERRKARAQGVAA